MKTKPNSYAFRAVGEAAGLALADYVVDNFRLRWKTSNPKESPAESVAPPRELFKLSDENEYNPHKEVSSYRTQRGSSAKSSARGLETMRQSSNLTAGKAGKD